MANGQVRGWKPGLADADVVEANRWNWRFNAERAAACSHVLFAPQGVVRAVAKITGVHSPYEGNEPDEETGGTRVVTRYAVAAKTLGAATQDRWYGQVPPVKPGRVKFTYVPA